MAEKISVEATINAPIERVWECYTNPEHVKGWNFASDDWHTPRAENDLRVGGNFTYRMEEKNGAHGFDFGGTYTEVAAPERLAYTMSDGRTVLAHFTQAGEGTHVLVSFDPEQENPLEMQRTGWQTILNNFRAYAERQQ